MKRIRGQIPVGPERMERLEIIWTGGCPHRYHHATWQGCLKAEIREWLEDELELRETLSRIPKRPE